MTKEILEALDAGGKDSRFENRDSRGREDEEERIVPSRAGPTSGSALLAMTRDGGAVPRPSHCEPVTDVTGVAIRDIRTPSQDGGERLATASERSGLALTGDEEERIATGASALAMTGDERFEIRESRIENCGFAPPGAEDGQATDSLDPDSQNSNLKTQNSSAAALRQRAAAHLDSLRRQAEALREEFPDFDLDAALRDPDFLRLTAPGLGVDLRRAYYALHREDLDSRAARRAAEETRRRLARSLASGGLRPREGGGQEAAAALASDYRSLSRPQQLQLKQRILEAAARGEKIYP